ncbi:hypothetical protein FN846DRAFT_897750 [Sphaerosporella brunnea]|uniref:Telomerase activating protein Est1-like N-terminal domain-containing protein n=1 Tax=Sphaerosporella brunnea TaxID=1250544 RepID=A0A5J5F4H2_9PEZI|nr:hypothetical protein FN846DRAFT_897750 [Sphaerosporella brunnea]
MWLTAHHRIIEVYRKNLTHFQEQYGRKRPVELRKLQDRFVGFIKQTTRFYRSFVQRLISHFQITELNWVVAKFHLSISKPDSIIQYDSSTRQQVIRSCHRILVILGDLSRYREAPANPKNWGPATGYYSLAKKLIPSSGTPHNQLAVIAINEGSNLSSTYHLYRAMSVAEPFPQASENLEKGFRKALKAYKTQAPAQVFTRKEEHAVKELISLFVRLHAKCFTARDFSDYESLESEMLTQLAQDLKDRNLSNGILTKMVLINIAAQFIAAQKAFRANGGHSFMSFLRLNVATFTTLHQVFQPELERAVGERTSNDGENLSAIGRRMLPSLRLYSTWLQVNHPVLVNQQPATAISVLIKQLWQTYANTLSLLAATFSMENVPTLDYLLEEDDDTLGFLPFAQVNGATAVNWKDEESVRAHPNEEALARICFLLEDGKQLCLKEDVPITASSDGTITYKEDGILTSTPSIGMNSSLNITGSESAFISAKKISEGSLAESVLGQGGASIVDSVTGSETMHALNRMVDSLVGPREEDSDEEVVFKKRR